MNYLSRRIGIWYKDAEWARRVYSELINNIPNEAIKKESRSRYDTYVLLTDDTVIKFVSADITAKGNVFSESYIQEGIDYDVYCKRIAPSCKCGCQVIFVVENPEDFYFRRNAQDYYIYQQCAKEYTPSWIEQETKDAEKTTTSLEERKE